MMLNCLLKGCRKSIASLSQVYRKSVTSLLKGCCNDIERSVETFVEFFFHKSVTSLSQVYRKSVTSLLKGCRKSVERLLKCLLKGCCVYLSSQVFASHRKIIDNLFDNIFNSFNNLFLLHDILIEVANFKTMIFFSSKRCTFILFIKSM